ncbi:MAG: sigma-70 family RNA polymerase sigma factor [Bacteroidales bacterium]|nr:sigma-70 family RNA polymerase sigma factor [Bacteroidales bacterium]
MTQKEIETLFRQHYAAMYRLARTILYDADESKDVVSDVFVRLLHSNPSVQADKMEGYLMMAVRNRCLDVLSHKSVREQVEKLFSEELKQRHIIARNEDERLDRLMQYIERELPPLSQQILRLRFLQEMTYEEVAQEVGVSKVTVYNHLWQSMHRIKEYFSKNK